MEFDAVIRTRRSIRKYARTPIADDVLGRILESALAAPTGSDKQTWHLYVVKSDDVRERLGTDGTTQHFIKGAPIVVVISAAEKGRVDAVIAADHLILAARNEGIGSCWVGFFDAGKVARILDVPADQRVVMLVPLGYPEADDAFTEKPPRVPLADIYSEL